MTRSLIDLATLSRIERTTKHARDTVERSFKRLQYCVLTAPDPQLFADIGEEQADRSENLRAAAEAIGDLTHRVLRDLRIMCELTLENGILAPEAQVSLSHIIHASAGDEPVVDLRKQRLLRLPLNSALKILLSELEEMCAEIDGLALSIIDYRTGRGSELALVH